MVLCKMEMALDGFCFKRFYTKWRWLRFDVEFGIKFGMNIHTVTV
jgi:hypothetical protein